MPASEAVSGQLQMSGSLNANGGARSGSLGTGTDKGHVSGSLQGSSASATLL
jgi:hypothetical protein